MSKVLVIGMGISGRSAARFLLDQGIEVWGIDRNPNACDQNLRKQITFQTDDLDINLSQFDQIIVSPGIPPTHPVYAKALASTIPIMGEAELALRSTKQPVIGVTGTNGKTTVTMLVAHVLNHSGKPAQAMGNIGKPLTSEMDPSKIIIAELSSYQLETMQSPVLDAAVILNISPDHLDRYPSMQEYVDAKLRIRGCLKPKASLIIEKSTYDTYARPPAITYGTTSDCDYIFDETSLKFKENIEYYYPVEYRRKISHDVENEVAAYALCRTLGVTADQFLEALKTFEKPLHRIEFVRNLDGISYYNDSKGTNIQAVIRAVDRMGGPVVLIVGGQEKGSSYVPWIEAFAENVKGILAIGEAAEAIKRELSARYSVQICKNLETAIPLASSLAKEGENVLLSPGCSSFDMFRDYVHRGEEFKRIVNSLTGRSS